MSYKTINVHEMTYNAIVSEAEARGQQISHYLAELHNVHLLAYNKFYDLEVGESMAAKHDGDEVKELNELRNKLGREFTLHPNPDRDDDAAIEDFWPYLIVRVK